MLQVEQPTIVLREVTPTILALEATPVIEVVAKQGPQGLTGATGAPGGGAEVMLIAGMALSGHRCVGYNLNGDLVYAANNNPGFFSSVVGVTLQAANMGDPIAVATNEEVQFSGWNWTMGLPVYLGLNGELTQVVPEAPAVFLLQVGFPTAPDKLWVEVEYAIEL